MTLDWAVIIILLGFGALGFFVRTFIKLTVSESIRHQFEVERQKMREEFERDIHTIDRKDKYQLVALEKRLEVHQQALALSIEMVCKLASPYNDKINLEKELFEFWKRNCLYLANDVRKELKVCLDKFSDYARLSRNAHRDPSAKTYAILHEIENRLRNLPSIIAQGVDLEAMGNDSFLLGSKKQDKPDVGKRKM